MCVLGTRRSIVVVTCCRSTHAIAVTCSELADVCVEKAAAKKESSGAWQTQASRRSFSIPYTLPVNGIKELYI